MTGLDPVIHAAPFVLPPAIRAAGTPWMPGSSPGMTICGGGDLLSLGLPLVFGGGQF